MSRSRSTVQWYASLTVSLLCIHFPASVGLVRATDEVPVPEFFGTYAVADGKLLGIDVSSSTMTPRNVEVRLGRRTGVAAAIDRKPLATTEIVQLPELPGSVGFLFYAQASGFISPMMIAQKASLKGLLYIRKITVDTGWPNNVRASGVENAWDSGAPVELATMGSTDIATAFQLLLKPIPNRSDIILAVPSQRLEPGVYMFETDNPTGKYRFRFVVSPLAEAEKSKCVDASYSYSMMSESHGTTNPCGTKTPATEPSGAEATSASPQGCADYDGCLKTGLNLFTKGQFDEALRAFTAAGALRPDAGDVHTLEGLVFLARGDETGMRSEWDEALHLGATLTLKSCFKRALGCEPTDLGVDPKQIRLDGVDNHHWFSVGPMEVKVVGSSEEVTTAAADTGYPLTIQVNSKSYEIHFMPVASGGCKNRKGAYLCPNPGAGQQRAISKYLRDKMVALSASTSVGTPSPPNTSSSPGKCAHPLSYYASNYNFVADAVPTPLNEVEAQHLRDFLDAVEPELPTRGGPDYQLVAWWMLIEGIAARPAGLLGFSNCKQVDFDPSTDCIDRLNGQFPKSGEWQVGVGLQVGDGWSELQAAMAMTHPGESPAAVGNRVLEQAGQRGMQFPSGLAVGDLVRAPLERTAGKSNAYWGAVLMRDPKVSAFMESAIVSGWPCYGRVQGKEVHVPSWCGPHYTEGRETHSARMAALVEFWKKHRSCEIY